VTHASPLALFVLLPSLLVPQPSPAQTQKPTAARAAASLPPSEARAKAGLEQSPRHGEYVNIDMAGGPLRAWIVYPERHDKAPVVIVIHEIFGLSDWVRGVADQLARDGFIAIAPDFLSGMGPNGGGSDELGSQGSTQAIRKVTRDDTNRILDAVRAYALTIPSANGKVATIGFCWGGGTSFAYALHQPALNGAVSYYGPMPADLDYSIAKAPILGLYGGNDNRVNAGIDTAKAELAKRHVTYDPHIFDGAGHGFLRQQAGNEQAPGNMKATEQAWPLTLQFLRKYTK